MHSTESVGDAFARVGRESSSAAAVFAAALELGT